MAKSRTYSNRRHCERCGKPVRRDSDFMRAHLWGAVVLFHWPCFISQMRESGIVREESAR